MSQLLRHVQSVACARMVVVLLQTTIGAVQYNAAALADHQQPKRHHVLLHGHRAMAMLKCV